VPFNTVKDKVLKFMNVGPVLAQFCHKQCHSVQQLYIRREKYSIAAWQPQARLTIVIIKISLSVTQALKRSA
jgi:hypothetical protein